MPGKGALGRGAGPGGHYWHVFAGGKRAGRVWINVIDEPPVGHHASLTIELNQASRGRHIGRYAYAAAAAASSHDRIYLHMRKSNAASRRAAEHAGFRVVTDIETPQLLMLWERPHS